MLAYISHCVPKLHIIKNNCLAEFDSNLKRGWSQDSKMGKIEILRLRPGSGGLRQDGERATASPDMGLEYSELKLKSF